MSLDRTSPDAAGGSVSLGAPRRIAPFASRFRAYLTKGSELRTARFLITGGILVYAIFVVVYLSFGSDIVSTADIHTEQLTVTVIDRRKAAFYIEGIKAAAVGTNQLTPCLTGLVTPAKWASVTYGRVGKGPIEIMISGSEEAAPFVATFEPSDGGPATRFRGATYLTSAKECAQPASFQFPIWGLVKIGHEYRAAVGAERPEPSLLIDGTLRVAAHAVWTKSLYEVTTVTIPVGSRVETYGAGAAGRPARPGATADERDPMPAIWWGTAYVDPDKTALVAALATEAPNIAVFRPNQTQAERIGLSTLAQLAEDPTFVRLNLLVVLLSGIVVVCQWLAKHLYDIASRHGSAAKADCRRL